jgi:hypothetical protein
MVPTSVAAQQQQLGPPRIAAESTSIDAEVSTLPPGSPLKSSKGVATVSGSKGPCAEATTASSLADAYDALGLSLIADPTDPFSGAPDSDDEDESTANEARASFEGHLQASAPAASRGQHLQANAATSSHAQDLQASATATSCGHRPQADAATTRHGKHLQSGAAATRPAHHLQPNASQRDKSGQHTSIDELPVLNSKALEVELARLEEALEKDVESSDVCQLRENRFDPQSACRQPCMCHDLPLLTV